MQSQTHIITLSPDGVENAHNDLSFDLKMFGGDKSVIPRKMIRSESRIRYAVTLDGILSGYVNTLDFGMELVRVRFSDLIAQIFCEENWKHFQVKYETHGSNKRVYKLYKLAPGTFFNSRTKVLTIQIETLPRLEFKRE